MSQLLMQGTGYTNFIGRYCWVAAGEHGFEAVVVTELDEPQAVIGSYLHEYAYPDYYQEHVDRDLSLYHVEQLVLARVHLPGAGAAGFGPEDADVAAVERGERLELHLRKGVRRSSRIGGTVEGRILILPDPMGATGSTTIKAVNHYLENHGRPSKIIAMPMIATPEYLGAVLAIDDVLASKTVG